MFSIFRKKQFKVYFKLNSNDWHGHDSESLWATKLSNDNFQIDNVPFFSEEIAYKDIVRVSDIDEKLFFNRVQVRSGYSSFRVFFSGAKYAKSKLLRADLIRKGCQVERAEFGEFTELAVGVPNSSLPACVELFKEYFDPPYCEWFSGYVCYEGEG